MWLGAKAEGVAQLAVLDWGVTPVKPGRALGSSTQVATAIERSQVQESQEILQIPQPEVMDPKDKKGLLGGSLRRNSPTIVSTRSAAA
jgi:hypothetical protein